jgi:hypothetical protein
LAVPPKLFRTPENFQEPIDVSALRSESLGIIIGPVNGWLNSRIRKSEAEADSAKMQSAVIVVAFMSAKTHENNCEPENQHH